MFYLLNMNLKHKEKFLIFIASFLCITAFVILTIEHIIFYNQFLKSNLNLISTKSFIFNPDHIRFLVIIFLLSLLMLLYYSIKIIIYNHKRRNKDIFYKISIIILIILILIYNPVTFAYMAKYPQIVISPYVVIWDIIHFLGIIFIIAFLFKISFE